MQMNPTKEDGSQHRQSGSQEQGRGRGYGSIRGWRLDDENK